jgi:hypothetical protein
MVEMQEPKPIRSLLVLLNLAMLLAPHVVRADNDLQEAKPRTPVVQTTSPPNTHHAEGKVRPQSAAPTERGPATASQPSSDDDDGGSAAGDVAGDVAGACCAGMIGAMAEPATPEDVEWREPPVEEEPVDYPLQEPAPSNREFDRVEADRELASAEARSLSFCGSADLDEVYVVVTFGLSGEVFDLEFTPAGFATTDHGRCVEGELLKARVPAFGGHPVAVEKRMALR